MPRARWRAVCHRVSLRAFAGAMLGGGERRRSVQERISRFRDQADKQEPAAAPAEETSDGAFWWSLPPEQAQEAFHQRHLHAQQRGRGAQHAVHDSGSAQAGGGSGVSFEGAHQEVAATGPGARFGEQLSTVDGLFSRALDTGVTQPSLAARVAALRSRRRSLLGSPQPPGDVEHAFELPPPQEENLVGWARVARRSVAPAPTVVMRYTDDAVEAAPADHLGGAYTQLSARAMQQAPPPFLVTSEAAAVESAHDAGWHFGGPHALDELLHVAAAFNASLREDGQRASRVFSDLDVSCSGHLRRPEVHALASTLVAPTRVSFSTSAALWMLLDVEARGEVSLPQLRAAASATADAVLALQSVGSPPLPGLGKFVEGHMLALANEFEHHGGPARRLPPLGAAQLVLGALAGRSPPSEQRALILALLAVGAGADDGSVSLVDTLRCALSGRPEPWVTEASRQRTRAAASTIQGAWKASRLRRWERRRAALSHDAAICMQAAARGFLVRQRRRKALRLVQAAKEAAAEAARVRAEAEAMNDAATHIQRLVRGHQARRYAGQLREATERLHQSALGHSFEQQRRDTELSLARTADSEARRAAERERLQAARLAAVEAAAAAAEAERLRQLAPPVQAAQPPPLPTPVQPPSSAVWASSADFPPLGARPAPMVASAVEPPPPAPAPAPPRLDSQATRSIEAAAAAAAASAAAAEAAATEAARHEALAVSAIQQDVVAQLQLALQTSAPPKDPRMAALYEELRGLQEARVNAAEQEARRAAADDGHSGGAGGAGPRECGVEDDLSHAVAHVSHDLDALMCRLTAMSVGMDPDAAAAPQDDDAPAEDSAGDAADEPSQAEEEEAPPVPAAMDPPGWPQLPLPASDAREGLPPPPALWAELDHLTVPIAGGDAVQALEAGPVGYVPPRTRAPPIVPDWARDDWAATLPPFMADLMRATVPELAARAWRANPPAPQFVAHSSLLRPATRPPSAVGRPAGLGVVMDPRQVSTEVCDLCSATWRQYDAVFQGKTARVE